MKTLKHLQLSEESDCVMLLTSTASFKHKSQPETATTREAQHRQSYHKDNTSDSCLVNTLQNPCATPVPPRKPMFAQKGSGRGEGGGVGGEEGWGRGLGKFVENHVCHCQVETEYSCQCKTGKQLTLGRRNFLMFSAEAEAKQYSLGCNARPRTLFLWYVRVVIALPLRRSHSFTVLSCDPVMT